MLVKIQACAKIFANIFASWCTNKSFHTHFQNWLRKYKHKSTKRANIQNHRPEVPANINRITKIMGTLHHCIGNPADRQEILEFFSVTSALITNFKMAPRFKIDEIYFYARSMIISSRSPIINSNMNTQKDRWNTFQIVTILFEN